MCQVVHQLHAPLMPIVSLWADPGSGAAYLLVLQGAGFCFNTNTNNKEATPALCDVQPKSISNVLAYSFGALGLLSVITFSPNNEDDWAAAGKLGQAVTPCHESLFSGMYDMGYNPAACLLAGVGRDFTVAR
jgi:hypothetical protein